MLNINVFSLKYMPKKGFHYVFIYLELLVFKSLADEPTVRSTKSDTLVSLPLGLSQALAIKFSSKFLNFQLLATKIPKDKVLLIT